VDTVETSFAAPADVERVRNRALIVAAVGLAGCAVGFLIDRDHFFRSWLIAYMLFLGIALGSLALMMVQHLSGGAWGIFRRIFEASSRTLPMLAVLFIPVILGIQTLYPWAHPDMVAADHVLQHREPYLNTTFWVARAVIYFGGWIGISMLLNRWSLKQDSGDVAVNMPIQRLSGFGLVFYGLTTTAAGIDWIMALNPHWYSTMFGFLMMAGQGLSGLAFTIVVATFLVGRPPMTGFLKPNHFHDLGKLLFAFVMLWTYFNFSQYMLTYAANLIEEVPYTLTRIQHGWQYLALFLVAFHFAVPWLLLLSRDRKRMPHRLVLVALWLLFMRFADIFMLVTPEFAPNGQNIHLQAGEPVSVFFLHWLDFAAPLAIGGLWVWMFYTQLKQRPLFPVGDPYLRESLETTGGH
jgi:hypothetical protein